MQILDKKYQSFKSLCPSTSSKVLEVWAVVSPIHHNLCPRCAFATLMKTQHKQAPGLYWLDVKSFSQQEFYQSKQHLPSLLLVVPSVPVDWSLTIDV